jgi:hypothetical protein
MDDAHRGACKVFMTDSFQSVRAALADPVKSFRPE